MKLLFWYLFNLDPVYTMAVWPSYIRQRISSFPKQMKLL